MKVLSINLWYDKYKNKTNAQLASFRNFGYETDAATITVNDKVYTTQLFSVNGNGTILTDEQSFTGYMPAFRYLFDTAEARKYDLIYIRRLMSKLFYAAPMIKHTSRFIPIVYEIPTFPLDTNETFLYRLRDRLEMMLYSSLHKSIALTTAILRQDITLPDKWISFYNGIDISNYSVTPVPELDNELRFIIVANMAEWHRYDRMINAMHKYSGSYTLHLTVVAPENGTVDNLKRLVSEYDMNDLVDFVGKKDIPEIRTLASGCHIGVGQLSWSSDSSQQINTLKTKDYCAMGLPFFTTCRDTSFKPDFPYAYVLPHMDDELSIEDIIKWYENIHKNPEYRQEMYDYAKENLQFHELVRQITEALSLPAQRT